MNGDNPSAVFTNDSAYQWYVNENWEMQIMRVVI